MPAHVHHDTAALQHEETDLARWEDDGGPTPTLRLAPSAAQWARIAAALSGRLPEIAGREDLIVTCEHITRSGAPAAFFPAYATVEVHTAIFAPHAPATIDPARVGDEERYPAAWGALVHEAAHAAHTRWTAPPGASGTAAHDAAELLEESRAERAHLARRPADRRWLRACVKTLVAPDFHKDTPATRWQAARAAALILARRDAGILEPDETAPLTRAVENILGPDLLDALAAVWAAAHTTADSDADAMLAHGQAWCDLLGTPADVPAPDPGTAASSGDGNGGSPGAPEAGANAQPGELAEAIGAVFREVAAHEAAEAAAEAAISAAIQARAVAKAARAARERDAAEIAKKVFAPNARPVMPARYGGMRAVSPVTGTREPNSEEKAAAGSLARALRSAAYRERVETVTTSAVPPGRLSMRGALARDAQKAAGATPTAQPWVAIHRRHTPAPPLRVGIAVDVSGSMEAATEPIASAAWILARAAALTDPDSRTATIAFRGGLTALTRPGRAPANVTTFAAKGGGHSIAETIDALTAGLGLDRPGAGRLLVIASDGHYFGDDSRAGTDRIAALREAGCAVLWLAFEPGATPLPGATFLELPHPARAPAAIAKAATAAIAATR